jgi:hypothetical protein
MIAIIFDVAKRRLIGHSSDAGHKVIQVAETDTILVTCEGKFHWEVVSTATIEPIEPAETTGKQS